MVTFSYEVYISQLIRFAVGSSHMTDFNAYNIILTAEPVQRVISIINFKKTLSKSFRRPYELVSKFMVG